MKMTPEQKASFEYGFEKGRLRMAIDTIRRRAWERHGARYGEVVFPVRELVWNEFNIKGIIACVRQKRAACRAWTIPSHERLCENCAHGGTRPYETPCRECFRSTFALSYEMVSDNWEPRKEGE
ncbi:MAG: hypothetical protein EGQ81_09345 [Akkermansia sp.]|nr:hypothetical protein [Akkermansia sp.]